MGVIGKIRNKLKYTQYSPLIYSEELRTAYLGTSIVGNRLENKSVLITGATGGIGNALALRFLAEKCYVILSGRNEKKLKELSYKLKERYPAANLKYIVTDLSDENSIKSTIDWLSGKKEYIDILINNAGVYTDIDRKRVFRAVKPEEFEFVWKTNFKGTVILTNQVAEAMTARNQYGSIVNIASICAEFRNFQLTPYGMSKSAIIGYSCELQKYFQNLTVTVIEPGSVATTMGFLGIGDNIAKNCNVLGHPALPEEIAAQAAFFASGFGRYLKNGVLIASACEIL